MQIIIPMSGFGERFRSAGYKKPKPLIIVDNKPIIAHVIGMFPGEKNFIFICNKDHLNNPLYKMEETILKYCPTGKIIGIDSHKLGPVHAINMAYDQINLDDETIVNYCDFTCYWSWNDFKKFIKKTKSFGSIPAYKNFHPHSLGTTNYAYIKENNLEVQDIQEKKPFTESRMNEFASSGTYFFKTGRLMFEAFQYQTKNNLKIGGEFYVSLAYKFFFKNKIKVTTYPLQHFMQWGTPDDLEEYQNWSEIFLSFIKKTKDCSYKGINIIPMAGLGQRFVDEGYTETKPLVKVSGSPMVIQAVKDLPIAKSSSFVIRSDMKNYQKLINEISNLKINSKFKILNSVTSGQAISARAGLDSIHNEISDNDWITSGACDNGIIFDCQEFKSTLSSGADLIVWSYSGHPAAKRNPEMFGWIDIDDKNNISKVSVKSPLKEPKEDQMIIGTFTFRNAKVFNKIIDELVKNENKINNEYYLDSCIEEAIKLNLVCKAFKVKHYISWGTPNELKTFNYWQSCFHKWNLHPYNVFNDSTISSKCQNELVERINQQSRMFEETKNSVN